MSKDKTLVKRKHLRYPPGVLETGYVDTDTKSPDFAPECVGLIIEESAMGGCSLAIHSRTDLQLGQNCFVKIGNLKPLLSEVRWKRVTEFSLTLYGFQFLE
jgi:hypothetical protein